MPKNILNMKTRTKGGKNLKRFMQRARSAEGRGVTAVQAGFFGDAENKQGQEIAPIAAIQEFGAQLPNGTMIPERPFMRLAANRMRETLPKVIRDRVDPATLTVDGITAKAVGEAMVETIQTAIDDTTDPANAAITQRRKRGNRPLVDSGAMRDAVDHEAIE